MRRALCLLGQLIGLVCAAQIIWAQSGKAALVEAVAPVYPLVAAYSSTGGQVKVKLVIDRSGAVTAANVVEGHKLLAAAAVEAARKWRFTASSGETEATIVFSFRIVPKGTSDADLATRFRSPLEIEVRRIIPDATTNSDPAAGPPRRRSK
ncbi:MAG: TonB family protein [Bryobacteraceae bacterium]|nr:TonB family protein [Bryobacteraceae bacterium]